jgi:hypothetical protein
MSEDKKPKIYLNDVFIKEVDDKIILCDIKWDDFKAQVESGICADGRTHDSLINRQGYINLVFQRKLFPFKKITHNTYNNDHNPNEK